MEEKKLQNEERSSKKRDFSQFQETNPPTNLYEEENNLHKQLYHAREQRKLKLLGQQATQSRKELTASQSDLEKPNEKQQFSIEKNIQMQLLKQNDKDEKNNKQNMETIGMAQKIPAQHRNFPFKPQKSRFYINKLQQYPKEEQTPYMLSFSDIFCENPFFSYFNEQPKRADVQSIFMTTYGYETELLMPILKSNKHFVLANDRPVSDKQTKDIVYENDGFKNWTVIHPPKDTGNSWGGAFHPKLWLIKFSGFLRVVIGSGNLHLCDWSVWSNCLWYQDFPKTSPTKSHQEKSKESSTNEKWDYESDFKATLIEAVESMMPKCIIYKNLLKIDLDEYDYSSVEIIIISNLVGRFKDTSKYGKGKLQRISKLFSTNQSENKNISHDKQENSKLITYSCTSLGNIDTQFLKEFYTCATGLDFSEKKKQKKGNKDEDYSIKFRLIYPTQKYIEEETVHGIQFASPVILNEKYYKKPTFEKGIFHQFAAPDHYFYHQGLIPHLKVFAVTESDGKISENSLIYIGSHNFTSAAWGRFEKEYSQIYSSNTEIGIVFPPKQGSEEIKQEIIQTLSFKFEAEQYSSSMSPYLRRFE